jgi:hypothetical protein
MDWFDCPQNAEYSENEEGSGMKSVNESCGIGYVLGGARVEAESVTAVVFQKAHSCCSVDETKDFFECIRMSSSLLTSHQRKKILPLRKEMDEHDHGTNSLRLSSTCTLHSPALKSDGTLDPVSSLQLDTFCSTPWG